MNFALQASKTCKTQLIDLDLVNPCFRLSERRTLMEAAGVRLIAPNYASTNVESMSIPPEMASAFNPEWEMVIFDVGGDPTGATALGRFKSRFDAYPGVLEVLCVLNVRRPFSETAEKIQDLMGHLEAASRLRFTGLVNNTNLGVETGPDELRDGYETLRRVSRETGVPVAYTTGQKALLDAFLAEGHDPAYIGTPVAIDRYMHRDWESFTRKGI